MANDPRLDWWDRKEFAGYVRNFYRKHSYRLFKYWEEEDAHQEMYLKFLRVLQTYPNVEKPQHVMGLFKVSLMNWANTCDYRRKREEHVVLMDDIVTRREEDVTESALDNVPGSGCDEILLGAALSELPVMLQQLLKRAMFGASLPERKQERLNHYLCRLMGVSPQSVDLESRLRDGLSRVL